jgi:hypothetical protein
MAGTIIADYIRTDANKLSLNVGNTTFATINATGFYSNTGTQIINQNGLVTLVDGQVTRSKLGIPGAVIQVVNATTSTQVSASTGTLADTGLTATITPTSATSRILVIVSLAGIYKTGGVGSSRIKFKLVRNSTDIVDSDANMWLIGSTVDFRNSGYSITSLDSPATTSATTYKVQFQGIDGGTVKVQTDGNSGPSVMTLMEIAG